MKVLYATDGSKASQAAALLLKQLADPTIADLTVLSVADNESMFPEMHYVVSDLAERVSAGAKAVVDAAISGFQAAGFAVKGEVVEGLPGRSIVKKAKEGGYDLVVVGAGSSSWLGHLLLGSVSTCVLQNSPVSVLVVHQPPRTKGLLRVLAATDGSDSARDAIGDLVSLADPARCEVTVLSVAKIPYSTAAGYPYPLMVGMDPGLAEEFTERARQKAESAANVLRAAGFSSEVVAIGGLPHHLILDEATKGGFDLVVVGSRGHGRALRVLLGSVSHALARHAQATLVGRSARDEQ